MSSLRERFYVCDATPEGERLLEESLRLQEVMDEYIVASPEAHRASIPGTCLLGAGKYSFTFGLRIAPGHEVAVKISEPTSSQEAYDKDIMLAPEDLREQFTVMSAVKTHLEGKAEGITAPNQYFVSYLPGNTFVLVHELMSGWVSLNDKSDEVYGTGPESDEVRHAIDRWTDITRARLLHALGDFALKRRLNDLGGKEGRLHGGNLLVPADAVLDGNTPICIIDQPGELQRR
ncbi:MAG TPA: hypothetical protein VFT59_02205 [Candidatus Saccharimonadales bacterium]|nr:hypothetical protein [Candidatus Saccharimonadales bacterium]